MKFFDDILDTIAKFIDSVFDSHVMMIGLIIVVLVLLGAIYMFMLR